MNQLPCTEVSSPLPSNGSSLTDARSLGVDCVPQGSPAPEASVVDRPVPIYEQYYSWCSCFNRQQSAKNYNDPCNEITHTHVFRMLVRRRKHLPLWAAYWKTCQSKIHLLVVNPNMNTIITFSFSVNDTSTYWFYTNVKTSMFTVTAHQQGCGKEMSYVSVHQEVSLSTTGEGGPHVAITQDALDLTVQTTAPCFLA